MIWPIWFPWAVAAGGWTVAALQAMALREARKVIREAGAAMAHAREQLQLSNELMTAVSRDKLAEKGRAR